MNSVYLSFLGLGSKQPSGDYLYNPAEYELNGKRSSKTEFVQVAEIEILGADDFDKFIIISTKRSFQAHFSNLKTQLNARSAENILPLIIEEEMSAEHQWKWFEEILNYINAGDKLTVDLTHGYRSVPIIFSTAINFLQKSKNIGLKAVYYGVYEKVKDLGYAPIIDMKDFYVINEWADAVSRLVEEADVRKIASVVKTTPEFQVAELNDDKIIRAFDDLTNAIRNVDINNIGIKANAALKLLKEKEQDASSTGKILLQLVIEKFASLTAEKPVSVKYDNTYFKNQLEIIRLLLEHKLFMQAFTVMRELIGSIGLIEMGTANMMSNKGRKQRKKADVFINMVQIDEKDWNFSGDQLNIHQKMKPYYEKLKRMGVEKKLRDFSAELINYRNGFDHAWTMNHKAYENIKQKGDMFFKKLKTVHQILVKDGVLV